MIAFQIRTWSCNSRWRGRRGARGCRSGRTSAGTRRRRRLSNEPATSRPTSCRWPPTSFAGSRGFWGRIAQSWVRGPPSRRRSRSTRSGKVAPGEKHSSSTSWWPIESIFFTTSLSSLHSNFFRLKFKKWNKFKNKISLFSQFRQTSLALISLHLHRIFFLCCCCSVRSPSVTF